MEILHDLSSTKEELVKDEKIIPAIYEALDNLSIKEIKDYILHFYQVSLILYMENNDLKKQLDLLEAKISRLNNARIRKFEVPEYWVDEDFKDLEETNENK
ncbi:MAG: hypothetical protein ACXACO_19120 [Promethearchaeota archaeon]|jgi:allophanate hydrolase subunit 1